MIKTQKCQVGTAALCYPFLIISSESPMKCEFVWNHVRATHVDVLPLTVPGLEVWSFSYHYLPAFYLGSVSIVDFSLEP